MRSWIPALLPAVAMAVAAVPASATSLQVAPVNIEVPAPGAASKVTLNNTGDEKVTAQVRVFKWTQVDGKDQLVPTRDVVASPPAVKLQPGKAGVVRIVRLSKVPAAAEENYRLIVDEVPKAPKAARAGVGFAVRYSVPVFFTAPAAEAALQWKAVVSGGQLRLEAGNSGGQHVRLADLRIVRNGKTITVGQGLAGYVLAQSARVWLVKGGAKVAAPGSTISIIAKGNNGPVEATARVVAAN